MTQDIHAEKILILDFGSQYTQLIARRVREANVYCEIYAWDVTDEQVRAFNPNGVILSGGPESVTAEQGPRAPKAVFDLGVPVLGICYGMQTMAAQLGGEVETSEEKEFGYARVRARGHSRLFTDIQDHVNDEGHGLLDVWMSHGDRVATLPDGFKVIATTDSAPLAGMADDERGYYGIQFHPEVTHTPQGKRILSRFVHEICGCGELWTSEHIIEDLVARIRGQVGDQRVLLGLSGGVDSSVTAALIHEAIGENLICVFVDNGLLRLHEGDEVMATFAEHKGLNVIRADAEDQFMSKLEGIYRRHLATLLHHRLLVVGTFVSVLLFSFLVIAPRTPVVIFTTRLLQRSKGDLLRCVGSHPGAAKSTGMRATRCSRRLGK